MKTEDSVLKIISPEMGTEIPQDHLIYTLMSRGCMSGEFYLVASCPCDTLAAKRVQESTQQGFSFVVYEADYSRNFFIRVDAARIIGEACVEKEKTTIVREIDPSSSLCVDWVSTFLALLRFS
jgi:hypothetical protein